MSRIDDALRRASAPLSESPAVSVAGADTFVSPWAAGDDRGARGVSDKSAGQVLEAPDAIKKNIESDPTGLIDEMIRATRPGGLVYLSYTVWLSPWGGHESAPFHYLGGDYAMRRYIRRRGEKPKNIYGETMFPLSVGQVLSLVRRRADVAVVEARPRYYPRWCRFLVFLPGLRELLTWNLLLILRRQA